MKSVLFAILTLSFLISKTYSQSTTDTITYTKTFTSYKYTLKGIRLSLKDMKSIMKTDSIAFNYIKRAKRQSVWSYILCFSGGYCIGFGITSTTDKSKYKKQPGQDFLGGLMYLSVGIPLAISSERNALKAVQYYNLNKRNVNTNL